MPAQVEKMTALDAGSTEAEVASYVTQLKKQMGQGQLLVDLLDERHGIMNGRSAYAVIRLKSYILASFAKTGLPEEGVPFVLDELENGRKAALVAAAARGLRGAEAPDTFFVQYLCTAIQNIKYHDDAIYLEAYEPDWNSDKVTSAMKEIFLSFQWMKGAAKEAIPFLEECLLDTRFFGSEMRAEIEKAIEVIQSDEVKPKASCCCGSADAESNSEQSAGNYDEVFEIDLENQFGQNRSFGEFYKGKPSVVGFFYTRCMNPNKCPLTINKLGYLQQLLAEEGLTEAVNITAMSYDPAYDIPARLHSYGENRGMSFHDSAHMLRAETQDFLKISDCFSLGVSYNDGNIAQHRIELYLLDDQGRIAHSFTRLQWDPEEVLDELKKLLEKPNRSNGFKSAATILRSFVFPLFIALFPKCPICWAAYMSAFGVAGLQSIPYSPWLVPVLFLGVGWNMFTLYRGAKLRNGLGPFWCSGLGAATLLPGYLWQSTPLMYLGIALLVLGSALSILPQKYYKKLSFKVRWPWSLHIPLFKKA